MPREKFGADMAETRLETRNVAANIISAGIRSQRSMGRLGVITSNIQQLFCILIGCFFLWHGTKLCQVARLLPPPLGGGGVW